MKIIMRFFWPSCALIVFGLIVANLLAAQKKSGHVAHRDAMRAAQGSETLLSDDFDDDSFDPARWRRGVMSKISASPNVIVAEQNQRLEIFPLIGSTGFNGYVASATYDFTAQQAAVEVVPGLTDAESEVLFSVGTDVQNNYEFSLGGDGVMYFVAKEAGAESYAAIFHDPEQHRHLRLRHDWLSDEMVWETSADRAVWTERHRKARGIALSAVTIELIAGTFVPASASPGMAIFDNFETTLILLPPPAPQMHFAVSPTGRPDGDGSLERPWDLATALAQPATVRPGATLWLLGGIYSGAFTSYLIGTASEPILVRQLPGERAVIDINHAGTAALTIAGAYTWFWGFEVMSSDPTRVYYTVSEHPGSRRSEGIAVYGPHTKLINLTVHDALDGIGLWVGATDAEVYGCLIYNNGLIEPNRGHGHGIYVQNQYGTKTIKDVISFNNYATGMKAYGEIGYAVGINFDGVISFNNGSPGTFDGNPAGYEAWHRWSNLFIGAAVNPADRISITNSRLYHQSGTVTELANLGLGYISGLNLNAVVRDNYVAGGSLSFTINDWQTAIVTGNTFYSEAVLAGARGVPIPSNYIWDNNSYFDSTMFDPTGYTYPFYFNQATNRFGGGMLTYDDPGTELGRGWRQWTNWDANSLYAFGRPNLTRVFIHPNLYEPGRAHLAVFNWTLDPSVTVSLAGAGLVAGQQYEIRDAQNYFGNPVASGTYDPANPTVDVPMSGLGAVAPVGSLFTPSHTAPEFAAFIVLPTG